MMCLAVLPSSVLQEALSEVFHVSRHPWHPMAIHEQFSTERHLCVGSEADGELCVLSVVQWM